MADSLAAFAAAHAPTRKRCTVCDLPPAILKQVNDAPAARISYPTIERWLAAQNHKVTRHQLGRHHNDGHSS